LERARNRSINQIKKNFLHTNGGKKARGGEKLIWGGAKVTVKSLIGIERGGVRIGRMSQRTTY